MKNRWENDLGMGFISVQEVKNVWIESMRKLDKDVLAGALSRDHILHFFDNLQYELYRRAKRTYEELMGKRQDSPVPHAIDGDSKTQHQDRLTGIRSRLV